MVPRKVCNKQCSSDPTCSTCSNFIQQGAGFGSCPSSTCGSFYPDLSNGTGPMGGGAGIDGYFPGNPEIGGNGIYTGSGGYYSGNGGEGGSGFYQGIEGGSGGSGSYYPENTGSGNT